MADEIESTEDELEQAEAEHQQYLDERRELVDAARESARTFDKAVLTFGSAVFGFSIAFLKDVAPHPSPGTMIWLGWAWGLFALGFAPYSAVFFVQPSCVYLRD